MEEMQGEPFLPLDPEQKAGKPKPHFHGHRERLRQKFITTTGEGLADYELLELLLCGLLPRRDVKPIAKRLIAKFGGVSGVFAASVNALKSVDGIGETVAVYLKAVHALHLASAHETIKKTNILSSWSKVQEYVKTRLQHEATESFRVLFLNRKNGLIEDRELGRGTVDHAPVYPREIARLVLELSASSIILVHNHPSGDSTPSGADVSMTREIMDILDSLEVTVHDHLVVGKHGVTSMRATGLI